ncbi:hypothetical protein CES85_4954 [Ochrobactrum quorumnocens]|uniref:Uncharacterized protein n=1 Tax=Ochrobactrum quorumnocens TaxID=271865 RepID=A0A248UC37_9HYPH|nr:hypothetical protein CES85_4954 [[Ochrobactrum] quorumnocens]
MTSKTSKSKAFESLIHSNISSIYECRSNAEIDPNNALGWQLDYDAHLFFGF